MKLRITPSKARLVINELPRIDVPFESGPGALGIEPSLDQLKAVVTKHLTKLGQNVLVGHQIKQVGPIKVKIELRQSFCLSQLDFLRSFRSQRGQVIV